MKRLAQDSSAATREVQEILQQNQEALGAVVRATEEGLRESAAGRRLAEQSGAANATIIVEVERTWWNWRRGLKQATESSSGWRVNRRWMPCADGRGHAAGDGAAP